MSFCMVFHWSNRRLSSTKTKYTDDDISAMKATTVFKRRYDKYLRKEIRPKFVMLEKLEDWFARYKCSRSGPDTRPAGGRLDPVTE